MPDLALRDWIVVAIYQSQRNEVGFAEMSSYLVKGFAREGVERGTLSICRLLIVSLHVNFQSSITDLDRHCVGGNSYRAGIAGSHDGGKRERE